MPFRRTFILVILLTAFSSCDLFVDWDKKAVKDSNHIISCLNSQNIQIFSKWSYSVRGNFWDNLLRDSNNVICNFRTSDDSLIITTSLIYNFKKVYPFKSSKDLSKFESLAFIKVGDNMVVKASTSNYGTDAEKGKIIA